MNFETHEELKELCRIASDVPALWHHAEVSNQDRKEILRCLIDGILVSAPKERIDARISWKTGSQTSLTIWRGFGRYNLIRELHAKNLTTLQIKEHLAAGKTSTGQVVNIGLSQILAILHRMDLEPIRTPANYFYCGKKRLSLVERVELRYGLRNILTSRDSRVHPINRGIVEWWTGCSKEVEINPKRWKTFIARLLTKLGHED